MSIWRLILVTLMGMASTVYARPAAINLERVQALVQRPSQEMGPNCFNSVLYLKGAVDSLQYISESELTLYLRDNCQQLLPGVSVQAGDVLVYRNADRLLVHASVALNSSQALEKDSLYGSSSSAQEGDPQPGRYLVRKFSESLYDDSNASSVFGEKFKRTIYRCEKGAPTVANLKQIDPPELAQQVALRKMIQVVFETPEGPRRESKIQQEIVPILKSIKDSSKDKRVQSLIQSNIYQVYLLACGKSIEQYGECYNPKMEAVLSEVDRLL